MTAQDIDGTARSSGRRAWAMLGLLCMAVVLSMTTWFSATAVTPELKLAWRLSDTEVAWLTNGVQFGFVAGALLASLINLPDIVRLNRLMAAAAFVAAAANAVLLADPGVEIAIACRFITGAALAGVYPPALKLISTWFTLRRGLAIGAIVGALTLGSAMPHLFRSMAAGLDHQLVIALSSLACLLATMLFIQANEGPYPFGKAVLDPRQIGKVLRDRNLLLVGIGYWGHMWELYAMWAWLLVFLRSSALDISPALSSLIAFAAIGSGMLGCLAGGLISDRFGRMSTAAGFMIISGSCALAVGLAYDGPAWLLVAIVLLWGVAIVGDSPLFSAMATELGDRGFVGTALSLQMGLGYALTMLAIWAVPIIAGIIGWQWTFAFLAPGAFLGAWAMIRLRSLLPAAPS